MSKKIDVSRRTFLQAGSAALTLPLAAALPAVAQPRPQGPGRHAAGPHHEHGSRPATIPYRELPVRQRGATVIPVDPPTDGVSDCSVAIQAAINALPEDGGTVLVRYHRTHAPNDDTDCVYMINTLANRQTTGQKPYYGIQLRSNMLLQFEPGVQLQAMPNNVDRAYMIFASGIHDVEIANGIFIGERFTHTNSGKGTATDEWGYGIAIVAVDGMTVRSTHVADFEGDGISIARSGGTTSTDVVLWDIVSTGNRRQALSITSGNGLYLYDSEFSETHGTAPCDGIDIEGSVSNVWVDNCLFANNQGNGIELNGSSSTVTISNINVTNSRFTGNYAGIYVGARATSTMDTATIYGNAFYQNRNVGVKVGGPATRNFSIGGSSPCDPKNNSFANNSFTADHQLLYPLSAKKAIQGYVGAPDMDASPFAQSSESNDVFGWNYYYSADGGSTTPYPCGRGLGHDDPQPGHGNDDDHGHSGNH